MLNRLIAASLRHRLVVVSLAAIVLVYGGVTLTRLPIDVLPDLNRPTVTILTEAPGLAAEEVETLVTFPLEVTLNGAPGIVRVRSVSSVTLSVVYAEFDWSTDIYRARQVVAERLQLSRDRLPEGVRPVLAPVSSLMGEILLIGLSSTTGETSPMELRTLAEWTIRQRLLTVSGIAQVTPIGGEVKQYQVLLDPLKMRATGLTLAEVTDAIQGAQANSTGGFLDREGREFLVRNLARTASLEEIASTPVAAPNNVPVALEDLGEVRFGPEVKRGEAGMNASPAVILAVTKQPGINTLDLTRTVEAELEDLREALPADVEMEVLFRQASFIRAAIDNVVEALRDGALLVAIVIVLFLANLRPTAITLTAIPLSLVATALVFKVFGLSIDTMTLGGLAIAVGELVDDAIVDVENVFRRLRQNRHAESPRNVLCVVFDASREIRGSIVFATVIVILVFIPLFALSGIEGRLFAPLGIAYIVSITASLLVSLTVTPVLCSYLLPRSRALDREAHGSRFVAWLQSVDRRVVAWALPRAGLVVAAVATVVLAAAAAVPLLGREFLPPFNEGTATITVLTVPGTSLEESNKTGVVAEQFLLRVPEVRTTGRRTGRAELDEHAVGVHFTEIDVEFGPTRRSREEVLGDVRRALEGLPGTDVNIGQPISHRLDHLLSGVRAQVAVKIFGPDLGVLREKAAEVKAAMAGVPGVVDLNVETQTLVPQVLLRVRRDAAARFGLAGGALVEQLETVLSGRELGDVLDGEKVFALVARYAEPFRASPDALRDVLLDVPGGGTVPLESVAEIVEATGPNEILRENARRRLVVSCNVTGRDLVGAVEEIQRRVSESVALPGADYFVQYGGQFESQKTASRRIAFLSLFSLAGMFLVLYSHFRSVALALQVLVNIPLALIGSVLAVIVTGGVFSIASLVGFVTLTGIAARNTIMMLSHYVHLVRHEGEGIDEAMVVRGSVERLVPVLMTALATGLALIPLALAAGEPGKEILQPVACVIIGGLMSSTLLDIVVTPSAFWLFGRNAVARLAAESATRDPLTSDG